MNPGTPDLAFINGFAKAIAAHRRGFIIFTGGGGLARTFQALARDAGGASESLQDELGIAATRINAMILKTQLAADGEILGDPNVKVPASRKVQVGAGWKPGYSTDHSAVCAALANGINTVVNISNTTHVYDNDPKSHPDAKPLKQVSWAQMKSLMPSAWKPGLNAPFDPEATKLAADNNLTVIFLGPDLKNFKLYLAGKPFKGTTVR